MPTDPSYVPTMTPMTVEELLAVHLPDKRVELVRGVMVVREPAGFTHGRVTANLTHRLSVHVHQAGAGQLFAAETGFTLSRQPDTVRAADIALLRRERLPGADPRGFAELVPDLVVEVLSPEDRAGDVLAKVADWINAGARLVWVIDPERRVARVYRQDGTETLVSATEALSGEAVLPGFSCPLSSIL